MKFSVSSIVFCPTTYMELPILLRKPFTWPFLKWGIPLTFMPFVRKQMAQNIFVVGWIMSLLSHRCLCPNSWILWICYFTWWKGTSQILFTKGSWVGEIILYCPAGSNVITKILKRNTGDQTGRRWNEGRSRGRSDVVTSRGMPRWMLEAGRGKNWILLWSLQKVLALPTPWF